MSKIAGLPEIFELRQTAVIVADRQWLQLFVLYQGIGGVSEFGYL
jgi:hypothetical protein